MKFGIVSLGNHALNRVMPGIIESGNTIGTVFSTNQGKGEEIAQKYSCSQHGVLEQMLNEDVDAVYISSPNFLHFDYSMAALRHGKHVLLEKPMTLEVEHARELVNFAAGKHLKLAVGFHMRFHPAASFIKEKITSEDIGEITLIEGKWGYMSGGPRTASSSWWEDDSKVGGGSVMGTGVHMMDFVNYILGTKADDVSSMSVPDGKVIDHTRIVTMRLGKTLAVLTSSRSIKEPDNSLRIFGTGGSIIATNFFGTSTEGKLYVNGKEAMAYGNGTSMYRDEVVAFVNLVNGKNTNIARGEDGLNVVEETVKALSYRKKSK